MGGSASQLLITAHSFFLSFLPGLPCVTAWRMAKAWQVCTRPPPGGERREKREAKGEGRRGMERKSSPLPSCSCLEGKGKAKETPLTISSDPEATLLVVWSCLKAVSSRSSSPGSRLAPCSWQEATELGPPASIVVSGSLVSGTRRPTTTSGQDKVLGQTNSTRHERPL